MPAYRCAGLWVAAALALTPLPNQAGHDQPTEDLVYFLPMAPERAKRLLDGGEKLWLIDLRAARDFKQRRLPGARSLPLEELDKRYHEIPQAGRVVLYCACPPGRVEEASAYQLLRSFGYRNVSVLDGGFEEWLRRGYPVEGEPR